MAEQRYLQDLQAMRQAQADPLSLSSLCAQLRQAVSYHDRQNLTVSADSARRAMAALRVFHQE